MLLTYPFAQFKCALILIDSMTKTELILGTNQEKTINFFAQ